MMALVSVFQVVLFVPLFGSIFNLDIFQSFVSPNPVYWGADIDKDHIVRLLRSIISRN
jgi:hypothetical protein